MDKINDQDFRAAVTEIAVQAREASSAWACLRSQLDEGPVAGRPARLLAVREAYYKLDTMRHRVLSVVGALTGTMPLEGWVNQELAALPALLEAAGKRVGG
jgi:hypothetical protein